MYCVWEYLHKINNSCINLHRILRTPFPISVGFQINRIDVVGKNDLCCKREVCSYSRCHIHIKVNYAPRETHITPNTYHPLKATKGYFSNMLFLKAVTGAAFLVCYAYSLSISSKMSPSFLATWLLLLPKHLSQYGLTDLSPSVAGAPAVVLAAISGNVAVGSAACLYGQVVGCAAAAIALGVQSVVATFFYLYQVFLKKKSPPIHHCFLREALGQAHSTSTLNTSQL